MDKTYWLAAPCPQCGEEDAPHAWKGARMSSTEWGHNYACCSDTCGRAFKNNPKRITMDREEIKNRQEMLRAALRELDQEDAALASKCPAEGNAK